MPENTNKKINAYLVYFTSILLLIFLGSTNKYLSYFSVIFSAIFGIMIGLLCIKNPSGQVCQGILILLLFQNLCIGIGAHIFGNIDSSLRIATQIPSMIILIIWLILEANIIKSKTKRIDNSWRFFLILIACIFFSIMIGRKSLLSMLMNIRNLTIFYMAYTIGKYAINSKEELNKLIKLIIIIAIIFLFFGIILLILGYPGYEAIGIDEVYMAKEARLKGEMLDRRFYTTLISREFMRMGSLLYEPVNLAYFYGISLLLSIFGEWTDNKKRKIICSILCGLGLILTFGKGGYLLVGSIVGAYALKNILSKIVKNLNEKTVFIITIIIIIIIVAIFAISYYHNIGKATLMHFIGIRKTMQSVKDRPYGYGLGTGGNMAQIFNENASEENWLKTGGETGLMSFMYQIGIQGVVALVLCMLSMIKFPKKDNKLCKIFNFVPIMLIVVSLMQENTFTPQCIVQYMLVLGAINRIIYQERDET